MSRRRRAEKREVLPDPKFGDKVISKFMCSLMLSEKNQLQKKLFMALSIKYRKIASKIQ